MPTRPPDPHRQRTPAQGARFHAICGEVARQARFNGRTLNQQQWKILLLSAHLIVSGEDPDLILGLVGEFVLLESTAGMTVERMSSLIDYATCWAVQNGVELAG